jgi:hypothetical protein
VVLVIKQTSAVVKSSSLSYVCTEIILVDNSNELKPFLKVKRRKTYECSDDK